MDKQTSQPSAQEQVTPRTVGTAAKALLGQLTLEPRSQRRRLEEAASKKDKV